MRRLIQLSAVTLFAGALISAPQAESAPSFPIIVDFEYTWSGSSPSTCDWTLAADGTFVSCSGSTGTWAANPAAGTLQMTYDGGTVYQGQYNGTPICADGTMLSSTGGTGTWTGCKR